MAVKTSASLSVIRPAGHLEAFTHASYKAFGSHYMGGTFSFTKAITIESLRQLADHLRARHQILQCNIQFDWRKKRGSIVHCPELKTRVETYSGSLTPEQYMLQIFDGEFPPSISTAQRRQLREEESRGFLPWRLVLCKGGSVVLFIIPHSMFDESSLDIVGSQMVLFFNGIADENAAMKPIPPPVEQLFGPVKFRDKVKYYREKVMDLAHAVDLGGIETKDLSKDWRLRRTIMTKLEFNLADINDFYAKCKQSDVSLNSGILSALFESLARSKGFHIGGRNIMATVAADARLRVADNSQLMLDDTGCYLGYLHCSEDGTSGQWETRAKSIQMKIRSYDVKSTFVREAYKSNFLVRKGEKHLLTSAETNFGRTALIGISNLGRTGRINQANSQVAADGVKIKKLSFNGSILGTGHVLQVCLSTVEERLVVVLSAVEPLVTEDTLRGVGEVFAMQLLGRS